jgi:hypothetical protein
MGKHMLKRMQIVSCAILVTSSTIVSAQGLAADAEHMSTGQFLNFCRTNAAGCQSEIYGASFDPSVDFCSPRGLSNIDFAGAVLGWMTAHTERANGNAYKTITDAFVSIWPCK